MKVHFKPIEMKVTSKIATAPPKPIVLDELTVIPTKEEQVNYAEHDGFSKVTVTAIPKQYIIPEGILNINDNGEYDVTEVATVSVDVPIAGLDTSEFTYISYLYKGNTTLVNAPSFDMSNVVEAMQTFANCTNLKTVPDLSLPLNKNMSNFFVNCSNLETVGNIYCPLATNLGNLFTDCSNLRSVGTISADKATTVNTIFTNNSSTYENFTDFGGFVNFGKAFSSSSSYVLINTLDLTKCVNLSHDSLMNIINNLYDIKSKNVHNQKILLSSNAYSKLSEDEIAIATAKGFDILSS